MTPDRTTPPVPESDPAWTEERLREGLAQCRIAAPPGLADRILREVEAAPKTPVRTWIGMWWPARWREALIPALAGAAAVWLVLARGFPGSGPARPDDGLKVAFELHAPSARSVELVGSFTEWRPGVLRLEGPDATGHWTATVTLPPGRHEYQFLVDGREWVPDPLAEVRRPDGFGRVNAVLDL